MRKNLNDVRVGFVISHPYHLFIYQPLIALLKNPLLIIETRKKTPFTYSPEFYENLSCDYVKLNETQLNLADQQVDIIFVMTPKHLAARFENAKTVVMQYGMAKEFYNYGLWRCRGDLNMMYGPYSHDKIAGYAVSRPVGNIRLDGVTSEQQTGGGGLLYIPTYGEISSLGSFLDVLPQLDPDVPIKIKLHHASEFSDADIIKRLEQYEQVSIVDGYKDVLAELSVADVVMSDYSGAIFDAVFMKRPVVLFQPGFKQSKQRTGDDSIEIERGAEFGEVLGDQASLVAFFERLSRGEMPEIKDIDIDQYLANPGQAAPVALDLLEQLINGDLPPSIVHRSIRQTYLNLIKRPQVWPFKQMVRRLINKMVFGK